MPRGVYASAVSLSSLSGDDLLFLALFGALAVVCVVLWVATVVGMWRVFRKLGLAGWKSIVPVLSNWELGASVGPVWLGAAYATLWLAATVVGVAEGVPVPVALAVAIALLSVRFVVCLLLARRFGYGAAHAAGLLLLPFLFVPMLGLGEDEPAAPESGPDIGLEPPVGSGEDVDDGAKGDDGMTAVGDADDDDDNDDDDDGADVPAELPATARHGRR